MASKTIQVEGMDELEKALGKLSAYATKTVIKDALKAEAEVVASTARELAPVKTGDLQRAIKARAGRSGKGRFSYLAALSKRWFSGDQFYGAFQEFGWKSGKRKSKERKEVPGEHFMEYAFEQHASGSLQRILAAIWKGIERELK